MIYSYAGVSTDGQIVAAQITTLSVAGAGKFIHEVVSGAQRNWRNCIGSCIPWRKVMQYW